MGMGYSEGRANQSQPTWPFTGVSKALFTANGCQINCFIEVEQKQQRQDWL
tara:strand:+ start:4833 stop:4985 length:153 start_codon:yes stop_codon:yes gene_type:complete